MIRAGTGKRAVFAWAIITTVLLGVAGFVTAQSPGSYRSSFDDERLRGLVVASREVQIGAPLEGQIRHVAVRENTRVKAGDLLVQLDDDLQKEAVAIAEMAITRQKLRLEEAQIQVERVLELQKQDSAKDWEVRQRKLARDLEQVELERAQQALVLEKSRLSKYELRAPFDGVVVKLSPGKDDGASVRQGDDILRMIMIEPLEAQMFLPLELYGELEVGRLYELQAGAPVNQKLLGKLKSHTAEVDSASETFRCVFTIDNPGGQLPAGFSVRLVWPQPK